MKKEVVKCKEIIGIHMIPHESEHFLGIDRQTQFLFGKTLSHILVYP